MFKHILVAVDGSRHAMKAAVNGVDLALKYGSKLQFLMVTKKPPADVSEKLRHYMEIEGLTGTPEDLIDDRTKETLAQAEEHARKKGLTDVQAIAKTGQPARTIVAHAKQTGVDLIVLGSRGLGDIEGMLLGSVSHKVCTLAECSCITVR
ncbi:MAG: universal stress protein [Dongiaceae bacterium]